MGKKVLIISSSFRKYGNSDILCDQFLRGAKESGNTGEKIFLNDKKISYCHGCGICFKNPGVCSINDDMTELLEKMVEADVIVLATPVYFYTMNAQMKTFIDRACSRYTQIIDKDMYFIVTAADDTIEATKKTIEGFRGFTHCLSDIREKGIIYGIGSFEIGAIVNKEAMNEAYLMGKNI